MYIGTLNSQRWAMGAVLDRLNEQRRLCKAILRELRALKIETIAALADLDHDERIEAFDADRFLEKATKLCAKLVEAQAAAREIRELERALGNG